MRKTFWVLTGLFLFSFNGRALADEITASASLNWAAASFSGAVAPAPLGGTPGAPSTEVSAAYGPALLGFIAPVPLLCDASAAGWTSVTCSVQAGPNDYARASANSELTAQVAVEQNHSTLAFVERGGTITVGPDGKVNIGIPFSATITPSVGSSPTAGNCGPGCSYLAQVEGATSLFSMSPTSPFSDFTTIVDIGSFKESDGTVSIGGTLDLADTGLTPGTYGFDVQLVSDVAFVPEPSTLLLLGSGLFGLAGISLRKRFA
jgi:PEP-CTERM motif-containing protein